MIPATFWQFRCCFSSWRFSPAICPRVAPRSSIQSIALRTELTSSSMITLKHLERFYPLAKAQFFYVLRDINLKVDEGDFVSIMGPSGAGQVDVAPRVGNARPRLEL